MVLFAPPPHRHTTRTPKGACPSARHLADGVRKLADQKLERARGAQHGRALGREHVRHRAEVLAVVAHDVAHDGQHEVDAHALDLHKVAAAARERRRQQRRDRRLLVHDLARQAQRAVKVRDHHLVEHVHVAAEVWPAVTKSSPCRLRARSLKQTIVRSYPPPWVHRAFRCSIQAA